MDNIMKMNINKAYACFIIGLALFGSITAGNCSNHNTEELLSPFKKTYYEGNGEVKNRVNRDQEVENYEVFNAKTGVSLSPHKARYYTPERVSHRIKSIQSSLDKKRKRDLFENPSNESINGTSLSTQQNEQIDPLSTQDNQGENSNLSGIQNTTQTFDDQDFGGWGDMEIPTDNEMVVESSHLNVSDTHHLQDNQGSDSHPQERTLLPQDIQQQTQNNTIQQAREDQEDIQQQAQNNVLYQNPDMESEHPSKLTKFASIGFSALLLLSQLPIVNDPILNPKIPIKWDQPSNFCIGNQ